MAGQSKRGPASVPAQPTDGDIQLSLGGQRACWRAASERGRAWVAAHPNLTRHAPEGVECLTRNCDPLITHALMSGLVVMAGDHEVTLR